MSLIRNYRKKIYAILQNVSLVDCRGICKGNFKTDDIYNNDNNFKCHWDRISFCSFQLVIVLRTKKSVRTRRASVNFIDAVSFKTKKIFQKLLSATKISTYLWTSVIRHLYILLRQLSVKIVSHVWRRTPTSSLIVVKKMVSFL